MDKIKKIFSDECKHEISKQGRDINFLRATNQWNIEARKNKYSYHFEWLGRPIIQYPPDITALQEIIWKVKPDLIIETGIAHGGSLIFYASILSLIDTCDAIKNKSLFDGNKPNRRVIGIDIEIRKHNRKAIEEHPISSYIEMIEGSSTDPSVVSQVHEKAKNYKKILVCLDSNHTHDHVLSELKAYSSLVSTKSYCIVFDTIIEDMPDGTYKDRPWGLGNNPKTAVRKFLKKNSEFKIDKSLENKLMITVAPDGYLKKIK